MKIASFDLPVGTHTVALGVGDLNGILRGKRIPATNWKNTCQHGNAISVSLFAIDMTSDLWDTPYVNFDSGYPDMHLYPMEKPVSIPWEEGVAFCLAYAEGKDNKPVPIDPRGALKEQLQRSKDMGFQIFVGTELEFYLLDQETMLPKDKGIQVYSLARASELEHVLGPIRQQINQFGIPVEQSNPEYAPGQVEVNIHYDEALKAADRVIMFRSLVKELAHRHGYIATFMAKPFIDQSGSGFHTHYSIWKDGKNVFADSNKLSSFGMSFLAGLQSQMAGIALAGSTTPNAFRRREPFSFCPINNSWGYDNRTVGIRVIEGSESAVRIEKRDAAADCNPYYLLACDIAAGLDGIEQKLQPTSPCLGNGYEFIDAEPLPDNMEQAIQLAKDSELMTRVLGLDRKQILIQQAEREQKFVTNQVTKVEIERYLGNF